MTPYCIMHIKRLPNPNRMGVDAVVEAECGVCVDVSDYRLAAGMFIVAYLLQKESSCIWTMCQKQSGVFFLLRAMRPRSCSLAARLIEFAKFKCSKMNFAMSEWYDINLQGLALSYTIFMPLNSAEFWFVLLVSLSGNMTSSLLCYFHGYRMHFIDSSCC